VITLLAVLVGGCAGAVARQEIYSALQQRAGIRFPVGILVVNLSGAFVLGLLYGVGASAHWPQWLATGVQTGVIGAYTTYSTWAVDSLTLARDGRRSDAIVNLAGSLVAGVLIAWAGANLGMALLVTPEYGTRWLAAPRMVGAGREGRRVDVIVGVDGSSESVLALGWACRRAQACGDEVRAVCAWSLEASGEDWMPAPGTKPLGQRRAERALREAAEAVRRDHPGAEVQTLAVEGHAAHVLVEMSAKADMLVVGSRGLGGFSGLLLGSVSRQCVHHARCPVTVVKQATGDGG
jgi:protein CrcB